MCADDHHKPHSPGMRAGWRDAITMRYNAHLQDKNQFDPFTRINLQDFSAQRLMDCVSSLNQQQKGG